jgi:hypothetical protein
MSISAGAADLLRAEATKIARQSNSSSSALATTIARIALADAKAAQIATPRTILRGWQHGRNGRQHAWYVQ